MILHKTFGQHLRLGNLLFKYAWTKAAEQKYGCVSAFPDHYLWKYLANKPVLDGGIEVDEVFKCRKWEYDPDHEKSWGAIFQDTHVDIDLACFFQSAKWFEGYESVVKEALRFDPEYIKYIKEKYAKSLARPNIAISIRRGDFVNHGSFAQIPANFYLAALYTNFNKIHDEGQNPIHYNIIFFSDDIEWCKSFFSGENVFYAEPNGTNAAPGSKEYHNDPVEQLAYLSVCDNFIISNSTFSWWGAFLGSNPNKKVIHSGKVFAGEYEKMYDIKDYYYPSWIKFEY